MAYGGQLDGTQTPTLGFGRVGPASTLISASAGSIIPRRIGAQGEEITATAHGPMYEASYRGSLFFSYVAAQALTASNTTYTGNIIWNGSTGFNLAVRKVSLQVSVTSASMTGIALGYSNLQPSAPTSTTAATLTGSMLIGGTAPQATAYKAATVITAGAAVYPLMHNTAAIATTGADSIVVDLEGGLIIPPGTCVSLLALGAASAAAAVTSTILWEEIPI